MSFSIKVSRRLMDQLPLGLLLLLVLVVGAVEPSFWSLHSFSNILVQSSTTVILATGMAFVLIAAGIDLSVGSVMYLGAALGGRFLISAGYSPGSVAVAVVIMLAVGVLFGVCNAILVTRLRVLAFIVTLGTLYIGRGLGHLVTETRALNLPNEFLALGATSLAGIPMPVVIAAVVAGTAHFVLRRTTFGRQVHAVGYDSEAARLAGVPVQRRITGVFLLCSTCAAIGGVVSLSQLGTVSPNLGFEREFTAIAAAVLGGVSLFGGRGKILPGVVVGALFLQTIQSALVVLNVDPYNYPIVSAGILFIAVFLDALKRRRRAGKGNR